jgi:hypothetical protein
VVFFGDLECPICRDFTLMSLPPLVARNVRAGKVQIVYRSFCTSTCNVVGGAPGQRLFDLQQVAAYAAGKQHLFWDYALLRSPDQFEAMNPTIFAASAARATDPAAGTAIVAACERRHAASRWLPSSPVAEARPRR